MNEATFSVCTPSGSVAGPGLTLEEARAMQVHEPDGHVVADHDVPSMQFGDPDCLRAIE